MFSQIGTTIEGLSQIQFKRYIFFQTEVSSSDVPSFLYTSYLAQKPCKSADRVRSMCFNQRRSELVAISSNGFIHCWDGLM